MKPFFSKLKFLPFLEWPGFAWFYFIQFLHKRITDFQLERNDVLNFCLVQQLAVESFGRGQIITYNHKQYILRPNSSDYAVFKEVLIQQEYNPVLNFINQENQCEKIQTILDVGSNAGYTSLLFLQKFPQAKIVALEPELQNFKALLANIKLNKAETQIIALNYAVWSREEYLALSPFRDNRQWSFSFSPALKSNVQVKALPLKEVLTQVGVASIDLCKIDIEGAEREIFLNDATLNEFLARVRYLVMEVHRDVIPVQTITEILRKNNFEVFERGSLVYGKRN